MKERARTLFAIKGGILEFLTKPPTFEWTPSRDLASLGMIEHRNRMKIRIKSSWNLDSVDWNGRMDWTSTGLEQPRPRNWVLQGLDGDFQRYYIAAARPGLLMHCSSLLACVQVMPIQYHC